MSYFGLMAETPVIKDFTTFSIDSSLLSISNEETTLICTQTLEMSLELLTYTKHTATSPASTDTTLQPTLDTETTLSTLATLTCNKETLRSSILSHFSNNISTSESHDSSTAFTETETTLASQNTESSEDTRTVFEFIARTVWDNTLLPISSMPNKETDILSKEETRFTTEPGTVPLVSMASIIIPTKSSTATTVTTPVSLIITETMLSFLSDASISSTTISAKDTPSTTEQTTTAHTTTLRTTQSTLTTMKPDYYKVGRGEVNVTLNINVVVVANYTNQLEDRTSGLFLSYQLHFTIALRELYSTLDGFKGVNVTGFSTGNIIVDHGVILSGASADNKTLDTIEEIIDKNITQGKLAGFSVNKNATLAEVAKHTEKFRSEINNLCLLIQHPCSNGYYCNPDKDSVVCRSLCGLSVWNMCTIHGQCQPATYENTTECRCFQDDDYLYHGRYCEVKMEKLKSDTKYTIAIIAGVSCGSLVILFVLVTIVVCILRRRKPPEITSWQFQCGLKLWKNNIALSRLERPNNGYKHNENSMENAYDEIPADQAQYVIPHVSLHGNGHQDSGYTDLVDEGYMDVDYIGEYEIPKRSSYIHATFDTDRKEWSAFASGPDQNEPDENSHCRGANSISKKPPADASRRERSFEDISGYDITRSGGVPKCYRPDERRHF
ncbi:hypothetical protein ACJMK2_010618 [Sinanodonta woodiana]|uniref:SEA domain-containing protein n=1 Tax=Sinanodonta woodiana TaxID=1069815 RepID=A0ABD3VIC5_SINWO